MAAVVLGQHVVAEIIGRVPPHRVDVIAVALGVVVLDEQPWSLDAEIMPLSGFGAARPGKDEVVHPGALDVVQLGPGHLVRQPPRERPHQGAEPIELSMVQRRSRDPLRAGPNVAEDVAFLVAEHVVRLGTEHRVRPLGFADPGHDPGGEVRR